MLAWEYAFCKCKRGHLISRENLEAVSSSYGDSKFTGFSCCCVAWASQGKSFNNHFNGLEAVSSSYSSTRCAAQAVLLSLVGEARSRQRGRVRRIQLGGSTTAPSWSATTLTDDGCYILECHVNPRGLGLSAKAILPSKGFTGQLPKKIKEGIPCSSIVKEDPDLRSFANRTTLLNVYQHRPDVEGLQGASGSSSAFDAGSGECSHLDHAVTGDWLWAHVLAPRTEATRTDAQRSQ